jgi:hypothetical protein
MTTLIGERGIKIKAGCNENTGTRDGIFIKHFVKILALGMFHYTSYLALFAANTPFRIDKNRFHVGCLLLLKRKD